MADLVIESMCGSWKVDNDRSENFEAFLDEMGIGTVIKTVALKSSPTMNLSIKDGFLCVEMEMGPKTKSAKIPLDGTEGEDEMPNGKKAKARLSVKDQKLCIDTKDSTGKELKVTRQIVMGDLVQCMMVGSVTAKRVMVRK